MTLRRVQVQGRDGSPYEFMLPDTSLPLATDALRLTPVAASFTTTVMARPNESALQSFLRRSGDASNLVLACLDADSWLVVETTCRAGRAAVIDSRCWESPVMGGHSLRFSSTRRKSAYVQHQRCVVRVAKAFEDLRRFARSPDSAFNPGVSLAETYCAEQQTGIVFPEEVRASFIIFDGQARSAWLRCEGVIGGFELLSLEQSVELMLEEACFRGPEDQLEFVPLADKRRARSWLAAAVDGGRICMMKPLSRPKVVASSWSAYLRVQ